MSKQELMDKVINEVKGVWGSWFSFLYVSGELNVRHPKHTKFTYSTQESQNTGYWDLVCNVGEFRQRAKELGWINGYKFGVEYPTNGKKPDLPDDVEVEVDGYNSGQWLQPRRVKSNHWQLTNKFRIVDERYKPVSENQEKHLFVSVLPESKQKDENVSVDNSWHERGEFTDDINVVIHNDVAILENQSGNVTAHNIGEVSTGSGDVKCGDVQGSVRTGSGDVVCGAVGGSIRTGSGDISHR